MSIFNLSYIKEASRYKSYSSKYKNDDDDEDDDDDEEERKEKEVTNHLSKDEINKCINIIKTTLTNHPKIKKCCDFIDLNDKEEMNDDGKFESSYDKYYRGSKNGFIELVNGDVWGGYPNYKDDGQEQFNDDSKDFVKDVNDKLASMKIPAKFSIGKDKEDEAVSFGVKSTKS